MVRCAHTAVHCKHSSSVAVQRIPPHLLHKPQCSHPHALQCSQVHPPQPALCLHLRVIAGVAQQMRSRIPCASTGTRACTCTLAPAQDMGVGKVHMICPSRMCGTNRPTMHLGFNAARHSTVQKPSQLHAATAAATPVHTSACITLKVINCMSQVQPDYKLLASACQDPKWASQRACCFSCRPQKPTAEAPQPSHATLLQGRCSFGHADSADSVTSTESHPKCRSGVTPWPRNRHDSRTTCQGMGKEQHSEKLHCAGNAPTHQPASCTCCSMCCRAR